MLSDRRPLSCLYALPVCNVGVFIVAKRSVGQDNTWCGGRPRPRPHCVRWGTSCPIQQPPLSRFTDASA